MKIGREEIKGRIKSVAGGLSKVKTSAAAAFGSVADKVKAARKTPMSSTTGTTTREFSRADVTVNADNLKDNLKNKNFWFSRHKKIINRGLFDHWPMGRGRYTENLTGVIGTDFYGENFEKAKHAIDFDKIINEDAKTFARTATPEMREAYSLLNNGFNARSVLGKLRDAELNESATKNRIETYMGSRVAAPDTDNWAILGLNEPVITPKEYANLLKAEMIVSNPIIEQDALENGADRTFAYSETAGDSYEPPVIMGDKSLNKYPNMAEIENFSDVLGQIAQHAKVRFVGSDAVEKGQVEFTKRRFYGSLRTIKNFVKKSSNSQTSGLPSSYTLTVSNQNTQGEQLYMIMKSMAELSVRPFVEETSRICGTAENLPSREVFEENRKYIERASACLIASDMCKMFNLSTDDAKVMSDYFKIEAAQNLGKITEPNSTTIMPLIADYYAESINSFAQDFGISIEDMAKYDDIDATSARNIGAVLYAQYTPQTTNTLGESSYSATRTSDNSAENKRLFEYLMRQAMAKKEREAARERERAKATEETREKVRKAAAEAEAIKKAAEEAKKAREAAGKEMGEGIYAPKVYGKDTTYYKKSKDGTVKEYYINDINCSEADYDKFNDLSHFIENVDFARFAAPAGDLSGVKESKVSSGLSTSTYYYIDGVPATPAAAAAYTGGDADIVNFNGICSTAQELEWYQEYTNNEIVLTSATSMSRPKDTTAEETRADETSEESAHEDARTYTEEAATDELDDFLFGMARGIETESGHIYKDTTKRGEDFRKLVGGAEPTNEARVAKYVEKQNQLRNEKEARDTLSRMAQGVEEENKRVLKAERRPNEEFRKLVGGAEPVDKTRIANRLSRMSAAEQRANEREIQKDLSRMARNIEPNPIESQRSVRVNKKKLAAKYGEQAANSREAEEMLRRMALGVESATPSDEILDPVIDLDDYYHREGVPAIMDYYFGDEDKSSKPSKAESAKSVKPKKSLKPTTLDDFADTASAEETAVEEEKGTTRVSVEVPAGTDLSDTEVKFSKKKKEYYGPKRMGEFPDELVDSKVKCTSKGVEQRAIGLVADIVRDHFADKYKKSVQYLVDARKHEESSREYQDNFNKSIENGVESNIAAVISDLLENPVDVKVKHPELLDDSTYEANKEICSDLMKVANSLVEKTLKFRKDNYSVTGPKTTAITFDDYIKSLGGKEKVKAALDEKYITPILNNGYFRIQGITGKPVEKSYE